MPDVEEGHVRTASRCSFTTHQLAVLCDLREENWPSMDLVADKLLLNLATNPSGGLRASRVCPAMKVRFGYAAPWTGRRVALNADRVLNRMYDYPAYLRSVSGRFEAFHICDHSYAQLVHALPAGRSGVFCHDLDTFRCLLEPALEPRPFWFRAMARRILQGLERAAVVFHTTATVRDQIHRYGLVDSARLVQAPYGIAEEFCTKRAGGAEESADHLLKAVGGAQFLLHVGSCIRRKRIDTLLDVFAEVQHTHPALRLVQVGGEWSAEQRQQIARHGMAASIVQLPRLSQSLIASLYRRASLVLMPSESEGFGLPVVEALACGSVVVASDIPVFREVGGTAAVYCPMADVGAWSRLVNELLSGSAPVPELEDRLKWTQQFSWSEHARRISQAYQALLER